MSGRTRGFRVLISLSFVGAILGCSPAGPSPSPPPAPPAPPAATFTLAGTIHETTAGGLKPAFGVQVALTSTLRTSTNGDGQYTIAGIPAGNHVVQITSFFHEPSTRTLRIDGDTRLDAEIVPLPVFTLSGTVFEVLDGVRVPISGVHVENSNIHDSTTTDQDGAYEILVHRGSIHLFVGKTGYRNQNREVSVQGDTRLEIQLIRQ